MRKQKLQCGQSQRCSGTNAGIEVQFGVTYYSSAFSFLLCNLAFSSSAFSVVSFSASSVTPTCHPCIGNLERVMQLMRGLYGVTSPAEVHQGTGRKDSDAPSRFVDGHRGAVCRQSSAEGHVDVQRWETSGPEALQDGHHQCNDVVDYGEAGSQRRRQVHPGAGERAWKVRVDRHPGRPW